jgi:hypothetical protein
MPTLSSTSTIVFLAVNVFLSPFYLILTLYLFRSFTRLRPSSLSMTLSPPCYPLLVTSFLFLLSDVNLVIKFVLLRLFLFSSRTVLYLCFDYVVLSWSQDGNIFVKS